MTTPRAEPHALTAVLASLGWTHEPSRWLGRHQVRDDTGEHVGTLTAGETWEELRRRGLVADAGKGPREDRT